MAHKKQQKPEKKQTFLEPNQSLILKSKYDGKDVIFSSTCKTCFTPAVANQGKTIETTSDIKASDSFRIKCGASGSLAIGTNEGIAYLSADGEKTTFAVRGKIPLLSTNILFSLSETSNNPLCDLFNTLCAQYLNGDNILDTSKRTENTDFNNLIEQALRKNPTSPVRYLKNLRKLITT